MNLLEQTQYLIKKSGLKPNRLKGQNFCIDEKVLANMIKAAEVTAKETVVEVGAGFGFLTEALVKKAGQVIAVELEPVLARILKNIQAVNANLEVMEGDILTIQDHGLLKVDKYKIVANLPYSITSVFLKKFLTAKNQPSSMTLLLQREVAERICARAGQLSLLAISVQLYARPTIVSFIQPASFWPKPTVQSAIIKIDQLHAFPYSDVKEEHFWRIVKSGYCAKRKTLHNNLANSLHHPKDQVSEILAKIGLKNTVRAQELTIEHWHNLTLILDK
ncbi:MAG: 16S rRNA (adenine(1518)-N(6)/adenine(1519)-N(6))-dimethyltransferase RsmA [Candidatus Komeilibacteria bacterium]|nr:16S rRNA (adenine(1518)-N(6)/adenine(1519)-N(6))-dimethyltransferase RsmA [Candidatus Komeilibacteria bacterium]